MKKQSQKDVVIKYLLDTGKVSRNTCIKTHFITRLGALICDLNKEGWELVGEDHETPYGTDYVYRIVKCPFQKVIYKVGDKIVSTGYTKI